MKAVEMLVDAILKGELSYYQATGSTAYVVEYEDGELQIVYNSLSAKEARPGVEFKILASAKWEDRLGNPQWTIYDDGEAVAAIATEIDGTVTDPDVYYYAEAGLRNISQP
jgi:hypothetical protein